MKLRKRLYYLYKQFMLDHFRPAFINREWKKWKGHKIDWKEPCDINEKVQWLMCFSDTSAWTRLSDKLQVREYVKGKGYENLLVPLLGTWEHADDIPYDRLPSKFVLKCNHDSGSTHIIDANTDRSVVNRELDAALKVKYGYRHGETYYNGIPPRIIAEMYLDGGDKSPVDYKIWCFDGKPYCIWTCYGRTPQYTYVNVYDANWRVHPEYSVFTDHYRDGKGILPKPHSLDDMLEAAAALSEGFPEVRVDFYEIKGRLYFGEMTFANYAGKVDFFTDEYLKELGDQITLPKR